MVNLVLATVIAGIIGYASIAFLLRYLKTHSTYLFILYRIGADGGVAGAAVERGAVTVSA